MKRALMLATSTLAIAACGKLQDFGGAPPPLFTVDVTFGGDLSPLLPPGDPTVHSPQVALVWGSQWLTEPFCVLPPETADAAAVIAAGCRDKFGFVPLRVGPSVPVALGTPSTLALSDLPTADLMVGGITARVAYATLVAYDDRDDSETLELSQPHGTPIGSEGRRGDDGDMADTADAPDVVYGVSFLSMTEPDHRVAYREGGFDQTAAFYPRSGCDGPPAGFSILGAGGFTAAAGLAASAMGQLPAEDPTTCSESSSGGAVDISARPPADLVEVDCAERADDGSSRYHEPPDNSPDFSGRMKACVHLPSFEAGNQSSLIQLVVSGRATDRCRGLTHYTLRGCRENVSCAVPDWDITATPPSWWPCP